MPPACWLSAGTLQSAACGQRRKTLRLPPHMDCRFGVSPQDGRSGGTASLATQRREWLSDQLVRRGGRVADHASLPTGGAGLQPGGRGQQHEGASASGAPGIEGQLLAARRASRVAPRFHGPRLCRHPLLSPCSRPAALAHQQQLCIAPLPVVGLDDLQPLNAATQPPSCRLRVLYSLPSAGQSLMNTPLVVGP